jgi:hypothetical protein
MNDLKMEGRERQMILDAIISAMAASKDEGYQDDLAILWRKIATSERAVEPTINDIKKAEEESAV